MFKIHLKKQKTVLYSIFKKPLSDIKSVISSCDSFILLGRNKVYGIRIRDRSPGIWDQDQQIFYMFLGIRDQSF